MKNCRIQAFLQKRACKEIVLSLFLLVTSLGGIALFIIGMAEKIHFYKELALLSFAAYFVLTWLCLKKQHKKNAPIFLIPAVLLFLLLLLY